MPPDPSHGGADRDQVGSRPRASGREAPDAILGCEAAQLPHEVYLRLRGRLAERRGWLWLSGTFEGSRGWYADHFTAWQAVNADGAASFSIPTWSNRALFPGGRADAEIEALEATYPAAVFRERFGGVPCPPATLVFPEFEPAQHVATVDPAAVQTVELAIDPGYAGAYAVLAVTESAGVVRVIDEVYHRRVVAAEIIAECRRRWWWPRVSGGGDRHRRAAASRQRQPGRNLAGVGRAAPAVPAGAHSGRHRPAAHLPARPGER